MLTINEKLTSILHRVKRPGSFYASGTGSLTLPRLDVAGVGSIALPLLPMQAQQLIQIASQAPYGKGEETVIDTEVRKTWQIEADKVQIGGKHWQGMLDVMVAEVSVGLGVAGEVQAELYKMLVYDEGSFFINHRDTEKSPGMFATLIIALPSIHTGGELRIEHAGQEVLLSLQSEELSEVSFAAFYADCVHEVLPVTSGCRLVLAYNLCRSGQGELPRPPDYQEQQQQAALVLHDWATMEHTGEDIPLKLVYLLEHAYTPESLSFRALKNGDAAIGEVVRGAAQLAACDLYLALVSVEESGSAEYNGGWGRRTRYRDYDDEDETEDDDFEIIEVCDEERFISYWHTPDGVSPNFGELPFEDEELCLPHRLENLKPDEQHFHEATGNEGASFERTYRRAALVLWPHAYYADALAAGGLGMTLPYLAEQSRHWQAAGADQRSTAWREASQLAQAIIKGWPVPTSSPWHYGGVGADKLGDLLDILIALQDVTSLGTAIRQIAIGGKAYRQEDNVAVLRALACLPSTMANGLLIELLGVKAGENLPACAQLLRMALSQQAASDKADFIPAAQVVLANIQQKGVGELRYMPTRALTSAQVVDILCAIGQVDSALGQQAIDQMLLQPAYYPMVLTLIPSVATAVRATDCPTEVIDYLRAACMHYLNQSVAEPLAAPTDWQRAVSFTYDPKNTHQAAFAEFLRDPKVAVWELRATQNIRNSMERLARHANADVTMVTLKKGSPHTLQFTKNQASYERRVEARKLAIKHQEALLAMVMNP